MDMSSGVLERRAGCDSCAVWNVRSEEMQTDNVTTGIRLHKNFSLVLESPGTTALHNSSITY